MKVTLDKEYRKRYTLEDLARAKTVIESEKEDEMKPAEWLEYAITEALKGTGEYPGEVITAEARTARNCRVWNAYGDNTEDMDIWIEGLARTSEGFAEVGAYLSDIWQSGAVDYKNHVYIQRYKRID